MIRLSLFFAIFTQLVILPPSVQAHVVKQLFFSLETSGQHWKITSTFDAAYALPEYRDDSDAPQPSRTWLMGLSDNEHERLRTEAETYLRNSLTITHNGAPVEFAVRFPDYLKPRPDFPKMLNGGAYFTIDLEGDLPAHTGGDFTLHLRSGSVPDYIIATGEQANRNYLVLSPGKELTLFTTTSTGSEVLPAANQSHFNLLKLGYTHVLPMGVDHILFILALFLMARKWKPLLSQSLTFTLAHSITLGLAASGVFQIAQCSWAWMIEPLIALSIAVVAFENLFTQRSSTHRLIVVFLFGLVHGLGFAGSLATSLDQGSSNSLIALALANIGVELAQVTILGAAWIATLVWWKSTYYKSFRKATSLVIGIIGLIWMVQRLPS